MKKMIPVYALLTVLIGALIFSVFRLTQHLAVIEGELAGIRREQVKATVGRPSRDDPILRVMVVNTPTVNVSEPLDVRVTNEPVEVEIRP